jgi:hypothetical protein
MSLLSPRIADTVANWIGAGGVLDGFLVDESIVAVRSPESTFVKMWRKPKDIIAQVPVEVPNDGRRVIG